MARASRRLPLETTLPPEPPQAEAASVIGQLWGDPETLRIFGDGVGGGVAPEPHGPHHPPPGAATQRREEVGTVGPDQEEPSAIDSGGNVVPPHAAASQSRRSDNPTAEIARILSELGLVKFTQGARGA